jgi:hypothetical protein
MSTLIIRTENEYQLDLLLKLAKELALDAVVTHDADAEKKAFLKLAETSFAKDWNSKEDEVWDDFLKNKKHVSKR